MPELTKNTKIRLNTDGLELIRASASLYAFYETRTYLYLTDIAAHSITVSTSLDPAKGTFMLLPTSCAVILTTDEEKQINRIKKAWTSLSDDAKNLPDDSLYSYLKAAISNRDIRQLDITVKRFGEDMPKDTRLTLEAINRKAILLKRMLSNRKWEALQETVNALYEKGYFTKEEKEEIDVSVHQKKGEKLKNSLAAMQVKRSLETLDHQIAHLSDFDGT